MLTRCLAVTDGACRDVLGVVVVELRVVVVGLRVVGVVVVELRVVVVGLRVVGVVVVESEYFIIRLG